MKNLKSVITFKGEGIPLSEIAITELGEFCDLFGSELIKHAATKLLMKISQNGIIFWPF